MRLAVNHDSDITGAITGNILGACQGLKTIPQSLIGEDTEVSSLIELIKNYGREIIEVKGAVKIRSI